MLDLRQRFAFTVERGRGSEHKTLHALAASRFKHVERPPHVDLVGRLRVLDGTLGGQPVVPGLRVCELRKERCHIIRLRPHPQRLELRSAIEW